MEDLWRIMEDLCKIYGGFMGDLWMIHDRFMEDLCRICGGFMGDLWRIYGGFMEDLWRICGGFMGDIWRIYGGFTAPFGAFRTSKPVRPPVSSGFEDAIGPSVLVVDVR